MDTLKPHFCNKDSKRYGGWRVDTEAQNIDAIRYTCGVGFVFVDKSKIFLECNSHLMW